MKILNKSFKMLRKIGQDMLSLRASLNKMLAAVRERPDKQEVSRLLTEHMDEMRRLLPQNEGEISTSVSVKCLSCGQTRPEEVVDSSLPYELSLSSTSVSASQSELDALRAILTRTAGLRPLDRSFAPMVPRASPFAGHRATTADSSRRRSQRGPGPGQQASSLLVLDEGHGQLSRGFKPLPQLSASLRRPVSVELIRGTALDESSITSTNAGSSISTIY
jgi:hypothetical protein